MLIKIRYIDNAFAYFTQNKVYTVLALDCSDAYPRAYVFDDNGDLRKTFGINDVNTNQWEIVSVEYGVSLAVYP